MKKRIAIIAPTASTFVVRDIKLLDEEFDVHLSLLPSKYNSELIFRPLKIVWNIFRSKVVISWFADVSYYSVLLSKLMGKKTIVIVGGYDVAKIESIGYGALVDKKNVKRVDWTLRNATVVTAVDKGLIEDIKSIFHDDFGTIVLPTGYDSERYRPSGEKEPMVLTVCSTTNRRGLVKGIDVFAECARRIPNAQFVMIGVIEEAINLLGVVPANLRIIGNLPADEIIPYYQKAKVYCQLSMREGLPNAVCEAMLCNCIAVGSDVQGVRTAVGEHGLLVPYGDVERTCDAVNKALKTTDMGGREWIISNFPEENRKKRLSEIISGLS